MHIPGMTVTISVVVYPRHTSPREEVHVLCVIVRVRGEELPTDWEVTTTSELSVRTLVRYSVAVGVG